MFVLDASVDCVTGVRLKIIQIIQTYLNYRRLALNSLSKTSNLPNIIDNDMIKRNIDQQDNIDEYFNDDFDDAFH